MSYGRRKAQYVAGVRKRGIGRSERDQSAPRWERAESEEGETDRRRGQGRGAAAVEVVAHIEAGEDAAEVAKLEPRLEGNAFTGRAAAALLLLLVPRFAIGLPAPPHQLQQRM